MNILFLTSRFPYPPLKGDQTVAYHRIRTLGKRHNILLLSFYEEEDELAGMLHLQDFCQEIITVKLPKWKSVLNIAVNFFNSDLPLQALYYSGSKQFKKDLHRIMSEFKIDIVHCFLLRMVPYLDNIESYKILELIDSMQLNLKRRLNGESFLKRYIIKNELQRICQYERNIGRQVDHLIVVAEEDRKYINDFNVKIIYNGVDLNVFRPNYLARNMRQAVFSGNMSYGPNQEAVLWFVDNCFLKIKTILPDFEFCIVGKEPAPLIQQLNRINGIKVIGYVPSMAEYLAQAGISVAPMQSGSGMQNKILEAMACGVPVITSTIGLGSIQAVPEQDILVYDEPDDVTRCIIDLMQDTERIWRMGQSARQYVEQYHNWDNAADTINELYCSIKKEEVKKA